MEKEERASKGLNTKITLEDVNRLIAQAEKGDEKAQDELMDLHSYHSYYSHIRSEINFLSWMHENSKKSFAARCYDDDRYAFFILKFFDDSDIKDHFPDLLASIRLRALKNIPAALFNLGVMYEDGKGGLYQDDKTAVHFYELASDQKYAPAQERLGEMYRFGKGGLPEDHKQAAHFYKLAANQGHAFAQMCLGTMYNLGEGGLPEEQTQFTYFYKLAVAQGEEYGQGFLGVMHFWGTGGLPENKKEGIRLVELSVSQGAHTSLHHLGPMYEELKDTSKAMNHYNKLLADCYLYEHHPNAHMRLGLMYENGEGIEKDALMAISHYGKALKSPISAEREEAKKLFSTYLVGVKDDKNECELSHEARAAVVNIEKLRARANTLQDGFSLVGNHWENLERTKELGELFLLYNELKITSSDIVTFIDELLEGKKAVGSFITCLQPTQKFLDEYRENSKDEKTGFCRVKVDNKEGESQYYYCTDENSARLGYKFKTLLSKKEKVYANLEKLTSILKNAEKDLEGQRQTSNMTNQKPDKVDEELRFASQIKEFIDLGYSTLIDIIEINVDSRNKDFMDANEELFK